MVNRIIRFSPSEYINEPGALAQLPEIIDRYSLKNPRILTDTTVYQVIKDYLPDRFLEIYPLTYFEGNCTFEEIDRLVEIFQEHDAILAFGGGQLMDTAKMVSDHLKIPIIASQTVPSNCAALTTKSIIYSQTHEKIDNVRHNKSVDVVLLDPELLVRSPRSYVLSGIGDTLAKFYEIRRRLTNDKADLLSIEIGRFYIELCRREMLSVTDYQSLTGKALINFIDTIFLVAASVDGIADKDGMSVAAHAFHNAYVKVKPTDRSTHGEIVALGNLFQVLLEGNQELTREIITYYRQLGLPLSLADLGLTDEAAIEALVPYLARPEDYRFRTIFPDATIGEIASVIQQLKEGSYGY
ncbi:iron-containing alcohol dehydrogenase family protein [Streptococcus dentasini]